MTGKLVAEEPSPNFLEHSGIRTGSETNPKEEVNLFLAFLIVLLSADLEGLFIKGLP
jgi:hypothetical protein